jgi:aminoglycoside 2''-phosphotransferase
METQPRYEQAMRRIRQAFPQSDLAGAVVNADGLVNLVIIDDQRVYRFARNEAGKAALHHEALVLNLVRQATSLAVPVFEIIADDFVTYDLVEGQPLVRNDMLRLPAFEQDRLAEQMAEFLRQRHSVPADRLERAVIQLAGGRQTQTDWLGLYETIQHEL